MMKREIKFTSIMPKVFIVSIVAFTFMVIVIGFNIFNNSLNIGIDFVGGIELRTKIDAPAKIEVSDLRELFDANVTIVEVVSDDESNIFLLRFKGSDKSVDEISTSITSKLDAAYGQDNIEILQKSSIGGVISRENMSKAAILILLSWLLILIYVSVRFEFKFALSAIVALIHDVVITFGIITLLGKEVNILILSALLTLIGYSVNDTIVLFDRIRENIKNDKYKDFKETVNMSINQTLMRTINTSVSTLLAATAIFVWGGDIIRDFAFAFIIGTLVGTYSSIFIASTLAIKLSNRESKKSAKSTSSGKQKSLEMS